MKENIFLVIKGFIMGIANVIPGVSGGTLALTLGIYEKLIKAISHFFKNLKNNIKFLLPLGIGMLLAIITMSNVIDYSFKNFPLPTTLFFMGLVIGGVPILYKRVKGTKESKKVSSYVIAGLTFALVIVLALSEQLFNINLTANLSNMNFFEYILLFLVGIIAAATMVIPGVSGSLVLMLLGYYYPILELVTEITKFNNLFTNIITGGVFGLGILVGIVGVSKLIEFLLEKYEVKTYFGVLGFILSSIIAIPIAALAGRTGIFAIPHVIAAVIFLALGVVIGYKLGEK